MTESRILVLIPARMAATRLPSVRRCVVSATGPTGSIVWATTASSADARVLVTVARIGHLRKIHRD